MDASVGGVGNQGGTPGSVGLAGGDDASAVTLPLVRPAAIVLDTTRRRHFVADSGNGLVRCVDDGSGVSKIVAGNLAATAQPGASPTEATAVSLGRPSGLAVDSSANELFVADEARAQILRLEIRPGETNLLAVLPVSTFVQRPGPLAFHRFATGQRLLFALDRGVEGTGPAASLRPRLRVVDLDNGAQSVITPNLVAGFEFRSVIDLAARPFADGSLDLYVLADVGEVSGDGLGPFSINGTLDFEVDVHNGSDDDGDGVADFADADARRPLQINVLRLSFAATGMVVTSGVPISRPATRHLRCFRRFPVIQLIPFPGCPGLTPTISIQNSFRDAAVDALAVDATGRLFLMDPVRGTVRFAEFNASNVLIRAGVAAGIESESALPFDGNDPRLTRWNRPLDLQVDDLGNLFVVDTANNRVRRMWVADIVGN